MKKGFSILFFLILIISFHHLQAQNPVPFQPLIHGDQQQYHKNNLGNQVFIFDPAMDIHQIQTLIDTIYNVQHERKSEFCTRRYALLFKPGTYRLDIRLGYYTQVLGLGKSPNDVIINGTLISKGLNNGNVTCNFWRSVENLTFQPIGDSTLVWGVSQAAQMRRLHVKGNIQLHDKGWASGGFLADTKVDGTVYSGPQQQWFSRNDNLGKWVGGNWNMMFVGVKNAPEDKWPDNPYTVIRETPAVREKPYLIDDPSGFMMRVPRIKSNSSGVSWMDAKEKFDLLPFNSFYIVKQGVDDANTINKALKSGKNLLITPGIYPLEESLKIDHPGTVVMGIGLATLMPTNGTPAMEIADVDHVTVCGIIVDAGLATSGTLLQVGENGAAKSHKKKPSYLFDVFFRVGGPAEGSADACLILNSHDVCVDHTWIWRADHGNGVAWEKNRGKNGLIVNGENVVIYGLFNEHFQEYQTLWNGENGKMYFYQSELPYDPPTVDSWKHDGIGGYASYKVADHVKRHEAWGLGIYCVFYKAPVVVNNTIETPPLLEKDIHHKIIFWLNGNKQSLIKNVINDKGGSVHVDHRKVVME
ncbi:MAG: coagulation factor 5/8 type domain-containing protein [Prolixibacteraceae bacterium]